MADLTHISEFLAKPPPSFSPHASAYSCEPCSDTGWVQVNGDDGQPRGVRECACLIRRKRSRALERIPLEYRGLTLGTIEPQPGKHERQGALIAEMRQAPDASYLLFGRYGCGKSLFGWLLYREAVRQGRPAVGMLAAEMLSQLRAFEVDGIEPSVTAGDLRVPGRRYLILLDDFDKARPTEFASEAMFRLLDAAYTYRHQVVITSNCAPAELQEHWQRHGQHYGAAMMRRLFELSDAIHVEMFA